MKQISLAVAAFVSAVTFPSPAQSAPDLYDIVIYGGTSAGISAAVQASRMGCRAVVIAPEGRIGGLTTGGLGQTDIGNKSAIGGIAREFYRAVKAHYADDASWNYERREDYKKNHPKIKNWEADFWREDAMWTFEPKRALFADGVFNNAVTTLRDVEFDYGIIPYPKWDTQQEAYYTSVDGGHEGLAAVRSISDPEFVGTIIEALCAESWKKTVPAYYDVALKYKGARDYESIAMIDMIMDSRIFDFGYVYGGWGPVFWIQSLLTAKNKDIASYYQRKHREFDNYMEKIYAAFDKYADEN